MQGLSILQRNSEYMRLCGALVVTALLTQGLLAIDQQYFVLLFKFTAADFAALFVIFGAVGTLAQVRPPPPSHTFAVLFVVFGAVGTLAQVRPVPLVTSLRCCSSSLALSAPSPTEVQPPPSHALLAPMPLDRTNLPSQYQTAEEPHCTSGAPKHLPSCS